MVNDETIHGPQWLLDREEESLILRFRESGDPRLAGRLMERYREPMRRLLFVLLDGDPEEMARAEREVRAALFRSLRRTVPDSSLADHLHHLGRKVVLRRLRRRGASAFVRRHGGRNEGLLRALRELPPDERIFLLLRDGEGFDLDSVSRRVRRPVRVVRAGLYRAREKLALLSGREGLAGKRKSSCCPARNALQEMRELPEGSHRILHFRLMVHLRDCPDCREFHRFLIHLPAALSAALSADLSTGLPADLSGNWADDPRDASGPGR